MLSVLLYGQIQELWSEHVATARACCSDDFWKVYESVRSETVACRDKVLKTVKDITGSRKHSWPSSTRTLLAKILETSGNFWDRVVETHTINLRNFQLPGLLLCMYHACLR